MSDRLAEIKEDPMGGPTQDDIAWLIVEVERLQWKLERAIKQDYCSICGRMIRKAKREANDDEDLESA